MITSKPDWGSILIEKGQASEVFQSFLDDLNIALNAGNFAVSIPAYAVADVPTASSYTDSAIIVTDEAGGRTIATSDGTNWRRVSDGAVVS